MDEAKEPTEDNKAYEKGYLSKYMTKLWVNNLHQQDNLTKHIQFLYNIENSHKWDKNR